MELIRDNERSVTVCPFEGDQFHTIQVYKPYRSCIYNQLTSEVNWGCFGAVNANEAELYAKGILEAVRLARQFDKEFAAQPITHAAENGEAPLRAGA